MAQNKYGILKRNEKNKSFRMLISFAILISWFLFFFSLTTQRVAKAFAYHPSLGEPIFNNFYSPMKIITWYPYLESYQEFMKIINQSYLFGVGIPLMFFLFMIYRIKSLKGRHDLHGSARWATLKEIKKIGYINEKSGVYIGGWFNEKTKVHHYLRHNGPEHILCFAPTRSGKGVGLILPTLLAWEASSVVLDIKGENFALTAGYLKSIGHKVLRFDPSDETGSSACFNPLAEIRLNSAKAIPDTQNLATMIIDPNGKGLDDHWSKAGFDFIGGALLHCLVTTKYKHKREANLYDFAIMLQDPNRKPEDSDEDTNGDISVLFNEMIKTDHAGILTEMFPNINSEYGEYIHTFIGASAQGMLSKAEGELSGVVNTVTANLALYKDPIVAKNTFRQDFKLDDLMNSETPVNLYLVLSPADIDRTKPLIRIFIAQLLNKITAKMEFEDGASKAAYKYRLLLLLDEFSSLGKIAIVEKGIAYMAGYGVKGYFIVQDLKQLNGAYGKDNALMANCHIRIAYASTDPETANLLSKMVGTTTVVDEKISLSGIGTKASQSKSINEVSRPLLTPDECGKLPGITKDENGNIISGDMLIFTAGNSTIYGRQILYFNDPTFLARAKIKPFGLSAEYPSGISDSLYYEMPIKNINKNTQLKVNIAKENKKLTEKKPIEKELNYEDFLQNN